MSNKPQSVTQRMATGAAWMVLSKVAVRSIALLSTIVLARLLMPADFGLVATATILLAALEIIGYFGFDLALIRDQSAQRQHYDTVWTLTLVRGFIVSVILFLISAPAATFFAEPRLAPVVQTLSLVTLIEGFSNVGIVDFRKHLRLDKEFKFQLLVKLGGFFPTVVLAYLWRDYWALIGGLITQRAIHVLLSYAMHSYRPKLSLGAWHDIIGFSKWLLVTNILNTIGDRSDTFLLAKLSGTHLVGVYNVAYEISSLPTTELVWPIQRALYPGYTKIASDRLSLANAYVNVISIVFLVAVPAGIGISLTADPLVRLLLGAQWLEAIPLVRVLVIFGVLQVGFFSTIPVLLALDKVKLVSQLTLARLGVRLPLLTFGILFHGPLGAAWALVASSLVAVLLHAITLSQLLNLGFGKVLFALWRTGASTLIMVGVVKRVEAYLDGFPLMQHDSLTLLTLVTAGAVSYVSAQVALWYLSGRPDGAEKLVVSWARSTLFGLRVA